MNKWLSGITFNFKDGLVFLTLKLLGGRILLVVQVDTGPRGYKEGTLHLL